MIDVDERAKLWNLVEDTIARWREGEKPDAAAFLARHPEIGSRKTLALDLIHEELCLRKESGDAVAPQTFIERFPDYRSSIAKMIAVEQYGEKNPGFAENLGESVWPQVGHPYQGFEVVEPLGRGAVARVYLARETSMGRRPVVIKVSPHGGHEAHLLGKLEHPNVVAAHSVKHDEATQMTVICMPLLGTATGLDLLDAAYHGNQPPVTAKIIGQVARQYQPAGLVKEESLHEAFPFARRSFVEGAVWLAKELAVGLVAAAKIGIAHRDIKPSNVLLAWSGRPMLLDFNLSSGVEDGGNRVGGTLAYMAPERIESLLADRLAGDVPFDPGPDIFSLGCVLYELLTGRLPVHPENAEASDPASMRRWLAARAQPVTPPGRQNRAVDAPIDALVLRCLAEDPARRFATAADLAGQLAEYLSPRQRAARWMRRNRRSVLAGSLTAAAAAIAGGVYWSRLPPYFEVKYREGLALHEAGQYKAAIAAFSESLERNRDNPAAQEARGESYYRLGLAQYDAGNYPDAILALNNSLTDRPQSVAALYARGTTYHRANNLPAAQKDFVAAATIEPRALFWFCAGACGLLDQTGGDYLALAQKAGYDDASVRCNLGVLTAAKMKPEHALVNLAKAIELRRDLQQPYIERAYLRLNLIRKGDRSHLSSAIDDIVAAQQRGPSSRRLHWIATQLFTHAIDDKYLDATENAELHFRAMRRVDDPKATYHISLERLFRERPHLADLMPDPGFRFVPDPPIGIGPPGADLSKISSR